MTRGSMTLAFVGVGLAFTLTACGSDTTPNTSSTQASTPESSTTAASAADYPKDAVRVTGCRWVRDGMNTLLADLVVGNPTSSRVLVEATVDFVNAKGAVIATEVGRNTSPPGPIGPGENLVGEARSKAPNGDPGKITCRVTKVEAEAV